MKYIITSIVLVFCLLIQSVFSLPIDFPAGGRAQRMGGAYTAAADNSLAIFWNPSGLVRMKNGEVSFAHILLPEISGLMIDLIGFGYPMDKSSFGAGWLRKGATLEQGEDNQETTFSENTFILGYGLQIARPFTIGVSMKRYLIHAEEAGAGAGLGFDLSGTYEIISGLLTSLVAKNAAASIKNEDIDMTFRWGTVYKYLFGPGYALGTLDLWNKNNINSNEGFNIGFGIGAEFGYSLPKDWTFYLSGGYSRSFGAGLGILFRNYKIDYAFAGDPGTVGIGASHIFSFSYLFGLKETRHSPPLIEKEEPEVME